MNGNAQIIRKPRGIEYRVLKPVTLKNEQNQTVANLLPNTKVFVEKLWVLGPNQVLAQVIAPNRGLVPVATLKGEPLITRVDQSGPAVPEERLNAPPRPPPQPRPMPQMGYPQRQPYQQMPPQRFAPQPMYQQPPANFRGHRQRSASAAPGLGDPRRNSMPALRWNPNQGRPPLQGPGGTLGGQPMLIGGGFPAGGFQSRPIPSGPVAGRGRGLRPSRPRTGSLLAGPGFGLNLAQMVAQPQPQAPRPVYNQQMPLRLAPDGRVPAPQPPPQMQGPPLQRVKMPQRVAQQSALAQRQIHPSIRRRAMSAAALPTVRRQQEEEGEHTPDISPKEWLRQALAKTDPKRVPPQGGQVVSPKKANKAQARVTRDDSTLNRRRGEPGRPPEGRPRRRSLVQRLMGVFRTGDKQADQAHGGVAGNQPVLAQAAPPAPAGAGHQQDYRGTGSRQEVPVPRQDAAPAAAAAREAAAPAAPAQPQPEHKSQEPMTEDERKQDAYDKGKEWRYDPERWILVSALCHALESMCYFEGKKPEEERGPLTKFHAETVPQIPLSAYLKRIAWFSECSKACFVLTLEYIYRLKKYKPEVEINSKAVHQLAITCIMVSAKFFDDKFFNNSFYARVGGLPAAVISGLELQLLFFLNFDLHVLPEDFNSRYKLMVQDNNDSHYKVDIGPEGHWKTALGSGLPDPVNAANPEPHPLTDWPPAPFGADDDLDGGKESDDEEDTVERGLDEGSVER